MIGNEDLNLFSGSTRIQINASETLLREILREMQKQQFRIESISTNDPES